MCVSAYVGLPLLIQDRFNMFEPESRETLGGKHPALPETQVQIKHLDDVHKCTPTHSAF